MRTLNAILMLLGALSVLMLGAVPAAAEAAPPPCHEVTAHSGSDMPHPMPDDAVTGMGCCVACVTAADLTPPMRGRIAAPSPLPDAPRMTLPAGLSPAPEPGPPKA